MFHSSTQKKHWLFRDSEELDRLRKTTSQNYFEKVGVWQVLRLKYVCNPCTARYHLLPQHSKGVAERGCEFLSPAEEYLLSQYFLKKLLEFCNHFQPPIPRSALVSPPSTPPPPPQQER